MAWYYVLNGASHGPVAEEEMRQLRAQNVVVPETPVWTEGMTEWLPFAGSTLGVGAVVPASVGGSHPCAECARLFPEDEMLAYEGAWVCAACKPAFFQRIREGVAPKGMFAFASVGQRFLALLIDGFVLLFGMAIFIFIPFMLVATLIVTPGKTMGDQGWVGVVMILMLYGLPPLYEIILIGKYGATLGKMAMKIKVVRPDGSRISYARSTGRYFAKALSGMILYIGFLMAFWDDERRALHDQICQTRVIRVQPS